MFRRGPARRLGALSGALLALAAACRCTGGDAGAEAGEEGRDAAPACDAAGCTTACLASGADGGRCVEDAGCRCNSGWGDALDANVCPPGAPEWNYPPIWERGLGQSWDFDPPTWDVSAARFQPQPGCELISLTGNPEASPGRVMADSTWVNERYVALDDLVTVCFDDRPVLAKSVLLLDTTTWTMSLIHATDPGLDGGTGPLAVFDGGIVFTVTWYDPCGDECGAWSPHTVHRSVLLYSTRERRQKVVYQYDGSRATLSLHASGPLVLHQFGWEASSFFVFDTVAETWSPLATFRGYGIGGVWHVDFSGERAVWDVWSKGGIMTAVVSRPEETSLIGYAGAEQWGPAVSDELVCWNEKPAGAVCGCPCRPDECPGEDIRCADLRTSETFGLSGQVPPDSCLVHNTPINSYVSVSGPWVMFHVAQCDHPNPRPSHARLFHRRLGRSFPFIFGGVPRGAHLLIGDQIVTGYFPRAGDEPVMRTGFYRCDLRVLFPEAYADPSPAETPPAAGW